MLSNILFEGLIYIKHQSFEIFSFWMEDINGMIGWLMELVENPDITSRLSGSREYSCAEIVFRHNLRTAECEEDSTRLYFLKRFLVQA